MTLERGTLVYAADPFKDEGAGRPWVIVSAPEMPFQGEQYIALALTTKTWYDERIPLEKMAVTDGGLPKDSSILPWAVAAIDPDLIDRELGHVDDWVVDEAATKLVEYLGLGEM